MRVIRTACLALLPSLGTLLCSFFTYAQGPNYELPKVVPPSPTAASLGKYGDVPVSLFSGLPNINIPLYELVSKQLSVPIDLSYHAAGVRVEDVASWVGIGWSLNAGGAITRSVRGRADEDAGRFTDSIPDTPTELQDRWLVHAYATNQRDPEPDIYYFNFNGRSGQLMYDEGGTFYATTADKFKFIKTLRTTPYSLWVLADEQGTTYEFGNVETTSSNGGDAYMTAWYLSRIISADLSDTISFTYTNKSELYNRPGTQTYIWHNNPGTYVENFTTGFKGDYNVSTFINGSSILSEIKSKKARIVFTASSTRQDISGGTELSKIEIFDKQGVLQRTFQFTYNHYQSRLFLSSVQEKGKLNEQKPPYKLYYNDPGGLPPVNSKDQDFWGFSNGVHYNQHLIPNLPASFVYQDSFGSQFPSNFTPADRSLNEDYLKKGTLNKIEYPMGGHTEFDFEAHEYINAVAEFDTPDELQVPPSVNGAEVVSNPFTLKSKNAIIDIRFNDYRQPTNYPRPIVKLEKLVNGSWTNPVGLIWQLPYPCLDNVTVHQSLNLDDGDTYRVRISNEGCPDPPCNTPPANAYSTHVAVTYFDVNQQQYINKGGGLRIKEVRDYPVTGGVATNVRKFEYDSGLLITVPVLYHTFLQNFCINLWQGMCSGVTGVNIYAASSQSVVNLGTTQGSHVVYRRVREKFGPNGENGFVDNVFDTATLTFNTAYKFPLPPYAPKENVDYRLGKLVKQIKYNSAGEKLEETTNTYKYGPANYHTIQGARIYQSAYPSVYEQPVQGNMYMVGLYNISSQWVYNDSIIHTTFHKNGNTFYPVEKITINSYDNSNHIQLTKSKTSDSEGRLIESRFWYPHDYANTDTVATLISKNIINIPLKEELHQNGQMLSGKVSRVNDEGKPIKVYSYESSILQSPAGHNPNIKVPTGYFKKAEITYNSDKNIEASQLVDDIRTMYVWGYREMLPIAKVENAGNLSVAATSFEPNATGNWIYAGPVYNDLAVKTGKYYYKLGGGSITKSLSPGRYKLEYWAKSAPTVSGGTITAIRESPADANGWILYEKDVVVATNATLTISGTSTHFIDELRVYPWSAQITTYTYHGLDGVTTSNDPTNTITYFEYDSFGRFRLAKDQYGNIVKTHDYHYKGF